MIDVSFKVKESSRRGKLVKTLLSTKDNSGISDARILASNACSICLKDVKESHQIIDCFQCNEKFHVPCLKYSIPSDYIQVSSSNPCLWWFCATCVAEATKRSSTIADTLNEPVPHGDQVDLMKSISDKFVEQISSLKSELTSHLDTVIENKFSTIVSKFPSESVCAESENPKTESGVLYSSLFSNPEPTAVAQPPQVPSKQVFSTAPPEVLVLSPKEDVSSPINVEQMTSVKKYVEKKLKNCKVVSLSCNDKSKKVSISLPSCDVRDKAAALLNADNCLDSLGYQSRNAKKMLPKITIEGISSEILDDLNIPNEMAGNAEKIRELEKSHIITKIVEKNESIKELHDQKHTLSVVYVRKVNRGTNEQERTELTVGIKVSPRIYQVIFGQNQGAIYLGSRRYSVSDRFHITTCYHCQSIGHTSKDCEEASKPPICMYCMGRHRSSNCTNKKKSDVHVCARCLASPHGKDAENAKTHNAGMSLKCPVIARETARLAANTDFMSKNVM